jgi:16S rRNA C967 or C1407 C5-methylase (RsmB/RsmF family)
MRNITVAVTHAAYRQARVWAVERDTSISAMVQHLIQNLPVVALAVTTVLASDLKSKGIPPSTFQQALLDLIDKSQRKQKKTLLISHTNL